MGGALNLLFNPTELGNFAQVVITKLNKIIKENMQKKEEKVKKYRCPKCQKEVAQVTCKLGDKEFLCVPCYNESNDN